MNKIAFFAALSAFAFLGACASTQSTTAPGAVGTKSACCGKCGNSCTTTADKAAAPGAVGEKKSGCCAAKSECSAAKSAPGAVGETKSGCASKCPATKG